MFRDALYVLTIASAFFFGFWEKKLYENLTDEAAKTPHNIGDIGLINDISQRFARERLLKSLPSQKLTKLRTVTALKFLCILILLVEVIILSRPK